MRSLIKRSMIPDASGRALSHVQLSQARNSLNCFLSHQFPARAGPYDDRYGANFRRLLRDAIPLFDRLRDLHADFLPWNGSPSLYGIVATCPLFTRTIAKDHVQ